MEGQFREKMSPAQRTEGLTIQGHRQSHDVRTGDKHFQF